MSRQEETPSDGGLLFFCSSYIIDPFLVGVLPNSEQRTSHTTPSPQTSFPILNASLVHIHERCVTCLAEQVKMVKPPVYLASYNVA